MYRLRMCANTIFCGVSDSFRWITLLRDRRVQKEIGQCCMINGVSFLLSAALFKYGFLRGFNFIFKILFGEEAIMSLHSWLEPYIFKIFVIIPLFLLTKFVWICHGSNVDVYNCRHLRSDRPQNSDLIGWSLEYTMDPFISIGLHSCFLLQTALFTCIVSSTIFTQCLVLIHLCLLYSLFAFEFVWFSKGWEANRRLKHIENNWLYFIGFGLPLAVMTEFSMSWFTSGLLFAVTLPLFIISGSDVDLGHKVCDVFPLRFFFLTRVMAVVPLFILTKETVLFRYPLKK